MPAAPDALRAHVDVLLEIVGRVPGGADGLTAAEDAEVIALLGQAQVVARLAESLSVAAAGEIARRSRSRDDSSLARRCGERSAKHLVAKVAGVGVGEAGRMVDAGEATRPRVALSGEHLPPERALLAEALATGELSVDLVELIDRTLNAVGSRLIGSEAEMEARLISLARLMAVAQFVRYCKNLPNQADPQGAEPRDAHLRAKASITETQLPDGMLRVVALLDPERAAYYLAAVRARTNPRKPQPEQAEHDDGDAAGDDARVTPIGDARRAKVQPTPEESRLDAFVSILRDSVKAQEGAQAGVDTTVLVRIDLDALQSGIGTATIDGVDQPVSAATARRMAVDAEIIPQVLGGRSQVLDQGEGRRLFTKAQRYAILAAYLGCVFPQCGVPSSMVEMHHMGRWATRHQHGRGTTCDNGLPLCGFPPRRTAVASLRAAPEPAPWAHRLMEEGWDVELDLDGIPWFIPPAHIDWARRRLRGGNLVRDLAA